MIIILKVLFKYLFPISYKLHVLIGDKSFFHEQMEVRASDIRVSERVCMSSITIDGYTTVYNELTDEVCIISIL